MGLQYISALAVGQLLYRFGVECDIQDIRSAGLYPLAIPFQVFIIPLG